MKPPEDNPRRRLLRQLTQLLFLIGIAFAVIPFFSTTDDSRLTEAPTLDVDIADMRAGETRTFLWHNWPVFILKRSPEMLAQLRTPSDRLANPWSINSQQPDDAKNVYRSVTPGYFVSYLGCSSQHCPLKLEQQYDEATYPHGKLICECGNNIYDYAGRIYKDSDETTNLPVPAYSFPEEGVLRLGE